MTLIKWTDKFKVDITEIDEQHKKLIDLANKLYAALKEGKARNILDDVFNSLADYASYHFDTEETLFGIHGYPDIIRHINEHNEFRRSLISLKEKHQREDYSAGIETMFFLKDWLKKHILDEDKKYAPFFIGKGVC